MPERRPQQVIARRVTVFFVLLAATMGFIGLSALNPFWEADAPGAIFMGALDTFYRTLQLFILEGPAITQDKGQDLQIWLLSVARFLAPAALAGYLVALSETLWRPLVTRLRLKFLRRHTIIAGHDAEAVSLAVDLLQQGTKVALVVPNPDLAAELRTTLGPSAIVRAANADLAQTWTDLALRRAHRVILLDEDQTNLRRADLLRGLAKRLRTKVGTQQVLLRLQSAALKRELIARQGIFAPGKAMRFEPFNTAELVARRFFHTRNVFLDAKAAGHDHLHWVVLGWTPQIAALAEQLAKVAPFPDMSAPRLTIYTRSPARVQFWLERRFSTAREYLDWQIVDWPDTTVLPDLSTQTASPVSGYIIAEDVCDSAQIALALDGDMGRARLSAAPIHVLGTSATDTLPTSDRVTLVSTGLRTSLLSAELDTMAIAFHDAYTKYSGGTDTWDDLDETFRAANRRAADHAKTKLEALGFAGPLQNPTRDPAKLKARMTDALEPLAIAEHDAWCIDRLLNGWRYGETRDNALRLHPNLKPYSELSEYEKNLDRWQVEQLPTVTASKPK